MRLLLLLRSAASGAAFCAALCLSIAARADDQPVNWANQGPAWNAEARAQFYSQDQGSRIMPLAWLKALKRADGQPFLADDLARYGYLPNPANSEGLPVGFTASGLRGAEWAGMSCAACHTRQISVGGETYRIDGGPAIADFQSFLTDLDAATGKVLSDGAAFDEFAGAVLGPGAQPQDAVQLHDSLAAWRLRYHALMAAALPDPPWGYGRLDAVSMIFNRLAGLDLGPPPSHLIVDNIVRADAPVRYPFLWNATRQDKTQWPGFEDNGTNQLALPRNLGEVTGMFGVFEPEKNRLRLLGVSYLNNSSANFDGLEKLEELMKRIGPPRWPWPVDTALADKGRAVFERPAADGGCVECHGVKPGRVQFPNQQTWATPVQDVGTDSREYVVLSRKAHSGVLEGAQIPDVVRPVKEAAYIVDILAVSVLGSILQNYEASVIMDPGAQAVELLKFHVPPSLQGLVDAFRSIEDITNLSAIAGAKPAYEARVLEGIWAAAPYLHNGSVPSLAELLKPAAERVATFQIGPAYDIEAVGLAVEQPASSSTLKTTDCSDRNSGDSRCGHEYGVQLPPDDKKALLEYLKTL
jgi:mono/diheme cytochrome c family protein